MLYIGTSGWLYYNWRGVFYPKDLPSHKWLDFYKNHFNTVEINSTFYRQVRPEIVANWQKIVGKQLAFSIKANRFITHIKRMNDCEDSLNKFLTSIKTLEATKPRGKHVVLLQFPPRWKVNLLRLEQFVKLLPQTFRFAFEFRDQTWFTPEVYKILKNKNCVLVIADSPSWPCVEEITANFIYLRFHGKEALYSSKYSDNELKNWARKIKIWIKNDLDVYAYFNNDVGGYAVENAKELLVLLDS